MHHGAIGADVGGEYRRAAFCVYADRRQQSVGVDAIEIERVAVDDNTVVEHDAVDEFVVGAKLPAVDDAVAAIVERI